MFETAPTIDTEAIVRMANSGFSSSHIAACVGARLVDVNRVLKTNRIGVRDERIRQQKAADKAARAAAQKARPVRGVRVWQAEDGAPDAARARAEALFAKPEEPAPEPDLETEMRRRLGKQKIESEAVQTLKEIRAERRRRFLLSLRFAKHWDIVWFLTRSGMSRRTLAGRFGQECVAWSRGEGFEWRVPQ